MKKSWIKTENNSYQFSVDDHIIGNLSIAVNSMERTGIVTIDGQKFIIKMTGIWKNSFEITDKNEKQIAKAYYEKWYANSLILEYKNQQLKLVIRNNPLAEWAVLNGDQTILSYGLTAENGKAGVKISNSHQTDYLLDFLLWYLFVPIATENSGDHFLLMVI